MQLTLTLEVCNHIAGKIGQDMLDSSRYKTITEFINADLLPFLNQQTL